MDKKAAAGNSKPTGSHDPATENSAQKPTDHSKTLSNILGEIIWLMTRSASHRYFFISDLEWMVMQPVSLGQFRVFQSEDHPVGVLFWAYVNEEVEGRLKQGITRLSPTDWKSGDRLWLIDAITPFGNAQQMLDDLIENVFPQTPFKYMQRDKAGKLVVRTSKALDS